MAPGPVAVKTVVFYDIFSGCGLRKMTQPKLPSPAAGTTPQHLNLQFSGEPFQLKRVKISVFPDFYRRKARSASAAKVRMIPLAALAAGLAIPCCPPGEAAPLVPPEKRRRRSPTSPKNQPNKGKGGATI